MIKITNQGYLSELGKRANNEDNFALIKGSTFVVCDGVGGAEKGEIASEIVSKYFVESYNLDPLADANVVLKNAEAKLSNYIANNPDAMGMATTLTFSQVRDNGIYVAWVGDSRIYQFRNGQIIFRSTDHSWVNDALKAGIITKEEAINHPKSNIITRAVQGNHKPTSADTGLLTDILKGDLFFQCTDGVLETWNDDDLQALFTAINDPDKILEKLKKECEQYSKDNFTAIVYRIEEASIVINSSSTDNFVDAIPVKKNSVSTKSNSNYNEHISEPKPTLKGLLNLKILGVRLVLWIVILISLIIAIKYKYIFSDKENSDVIENTNVEKKTESGNGKVIQEARGSVEDDLIEQGYIKNKPVLDENKLYNINNLSNKIKDKDSLKNRTQTQWNELKQQLINDKQKLISESIIKYDSLIINNKTYYKLKQ
jgi:serine/threonine protein phosphatase PrpC